MPKGEIVCEGCGQYESECFCDSIQRITDRVMEAIKNAKAKREAEAQNSTGKTITDSGRQNA